MDVAQRVLNTLKDNLLPGMSALNSIDTETYFILLLGALIGFLGASVLKAFLSLGFALGQLLIVASKRLLDVFTQTAMLCKDLWLGYMLPYLWYACSWKTYKKVMPWRGTIPVPAAQRKLASQPRSKYESYGSEKDLEFFERRVSGEDGPNWRPICQRSLEDYLKYDAQFRIIEGNKTEYKSISVLKNSTAEELTEFYLNDDLRCQWDSLLATTESVEASQNAFQYEVVRWVRSFPFPFLSDREYVIARKVFKRGDVMYTISRGTNHDSVPVKPSVVRMDFYYSMWRCRNVPCPWGSSKTACEVVLLHHEQFKIPEKLARFAAMRAMWGFVKSMGPAMVSFVEKQRQPYSLDATNRRRLTQSGSECSMDLADSDANSPAAGKKKLMRTIRRALVATVFGTSILLIRKLHKNQMS